MRINQLAVALLIVSSSVRGRAQSLDTRKVDSLAKAISHAEGFGRSQTLPSRYHNPGDLKAFSDSTRLAGQVRIGKAGHIVFKDDEAGTAALRDYILSMVDGRSRHYHPNMTFSEVAHIYAEDWHPWVRAVSHELGVSPSTTLRAYFHASDGHSAARMTLNFRPLPAVNPTPVPPAINSSEWPSVLYAMMDMPVRIPPLVEDDVPQHRKLKLLHPRAVSYGQTMSAQTALADNARDNRTAWQ